ncbi:MAG: helix-turn-helix domain-containing protein, partial [Betaproteobacteria bacterium]|nr:helix-turn-helix domain-containing protein [Betaproteobacteria bacterium]
LVLRMTREDIGSYLGLKLETVSRLLSRFHDEGLLAVRGRNIQILNADGLNRLVGAA